MATTETLYIESATNLENRLTRICQIIEGLEAQQLIMAQGTTQDISEYSLNDGQVTIRTVYKSLSEITTALTFYERTKQKLLNQLNGRVIALRSWEGIR